MENRKIRAAAMEAGVPIWKIAQDLGVSEATMTRRLRVELTEEQKAEIMASIRRLSGEV